MRVGARALLVAIFLQIFWAMECRIYRPPCPASPAAFICYCLAAVLITCVFPEQRKTASRARQDGICNTKCSAASSRRAREISSKRPTITGHDNPGRGLAKTSNPPMSTAFHAHFVALFCLSRTFGSAVRIASSTVLNLIGRIFQGFARTPVIR